MQHIHITLVGEQSAPVYYLIQELKPDEVLYIASEDTCYRLDALSSEVNEIKEVKVQDNMILDPTNVKEIVKRFNGLARKYKDWQVSINVTSGTKPWSIFIMQEFEEHPNVKFYYIDQDNKLWDLKEHTPSKIDIKMDIDQHFRLYGNKSTNYKKISEYTDEDILQIAKIRKLRSMNQNVFHDLIVQLNSILSHPSVDPCAKIKGSTLKWDKAKNEFRGELERRNLTPYRYSLSSPNIKDMLLKSGWFELEVALMLQKWGKQNEIRMNCVFQSKDKNNKKVDLNEIDIIVKTDIKLLFVECKTKIKNVTDIDKFRSVVRNYGGLNSKAIFITDSNIEPEVLSKLDTNEMPYFSMHDNNLNQAIEDALFFKLDSVLNGPNPR